MAIQPFFIYVRIYFINYNNAMLKVDIILSLFLLEFVSDYLLMKLFKIKNNTLYILFLQIPKICANILSLEIIASFTIALLVKIFTDIVVLLFMTDAFKIKKLLALLMTKVIFICSVAGFLLFMILWVENSVSALVNVNLRKCYRFPIILAVILYIFCIFRLVRIWEKNKIMKYFLANVSLFVLGKHIRFYGLIDSGNSLYDPLSKKPVILVSKNSMKRFLVEEEFEKLLNYHCYDLKCSTIADQKVFIPILKCKDVEIKIENHYEKISCVIGFVDERFENGKYDCLLPRDVI